MLTTLVAALTCFTSPVSAKDVMAPYLLVCSNRVRFDGPAPIEFTVGTIGIYSFRSEWSKTIGRLRKRLKDVDGYEEFAGFSGMRWPMNSADHSFHWWNGKMAPAIGVYRDFMALPQVVKDTYSASFPQKLKGTPKKGWITVLAFDGQTIYR